MGNLENDILSKFEMIELKKEVISILHSIQYDCCYSVEDYIIDLHKLLSILDEMEIPHKNLMNLNKMNLTKDAITKNLAEKDLITA
ncbi:hypothetical protein [Radiobacillus deserti]|uniref:Uncharacterized protein n=1 Tax=Radiobacillus deserti TaxID=2594883 RepID=A0A516KCY6_9BACI|nr:hypothetical protein [Radiobacillus deserti]QDP39264.1 hypothetical protein FN924_03055 [Radiobacillus deserti]